MNLDNQPNPQEGMTNNGVNPTPVVGPTPVQPEQVGTPIAEGQPVAQPVPPVQPQPTVNPAPTPGPAAEQQTINQGANPAEQAQGSQTQSGPSFTDQVNNVLNDVNDVSGTFSEQDINDGKVMAILSYLGLLSLIPFFTEKTNQYVIYHAKQGVNLLIYEAAAAFAVAIVSILFAVLSPLAGWMLSSLLWTAYALGAGALIVIGIINVANNQAKELPVINKFKIIK